MTHICFSASASFGAGIVLFGVGAVTLRRARTRAELPYAAIPVLFAIQQCVEGALWLGLPGGAMEGPDPAIHALTITYLLFANVLWPAYVPAAVWLIEPDPARRKAILAAQAVGIATSLYFLAAIVTSQVSATIAGAHISYSLPQAPEDAAFVFYAFATCVAPLMSSYPKVRLFGFAIIGAMIVAYLVWWLWFASVWCFLAALCSAVVVLHFTAERRGVTIRS